MGGKHWGAIALRAGLCLAGGCGEDLYPQYTGSYELVRVDRVGEASGGLDMPTEVRVTQHMKYVGQSFVHYLEVEAPSVEHNDRRVQGRFFVPLTAAAGSRSIRELGSAKDGVRGGVNCAGEGNYAVIVDAELTDPPVAILQDVYVGTRVYHGYKTQLSPGELSDGPIDEGARDNWVEAAVSAQGLRLTLVVTRSIRSAPGACEQIEPLMFDGYNGYLVVTYQAKRSWRDPLHRDLRKDASSFVAPSSSDMSQAWTEFFRPAFGGGAGR